MQKNIIICSLFLVSVAYAVETYRRFTESGGMQWRTGEWIPSDERKHLQDLDREREKNRISPTNSTMKQLRYGVDLNRRKK